MSFHSTPPLPLFLFCMPLTEDWMAESEMDCWAVAFHADNAIWWRRVFDVAPAYNERIKRSKAAADFAWRKLSSVITSSLHVVRRGLNSGRGFSEKKKVRERVREGGKERGREREREWDCPVRALLVPPPPSTALEGPADQQLEGLWSPVSSPPNQNKFASKCFCFFF